MNCGIVVYHQKLTLCSDVCAFVFFLNAWACLAGLASFFPHLCLTSPSCSRGATNIRCVLHLKLSSLAARRPGWAMLASFSVLPWLWGWWTGKWKPSTGSPRLSSPPVNGSFVFAENKPETHPAMAIVCRLLHHLDSDSVRGLVIETSTCLLEIQGNHLIIFTVSASSTHLPVFVSLTPVFVGYSEIQFPNTVLEVYSS